MIELLTVSGVCGDKQHAPTAIDMQTKVTDKSYPSELTMKNTLLKLLIQAAIDVLIDKLKKRNK